MSEKETTNRSEEVLTGEQRAVIDADGKTIVSASAGSGKTFVMIEKICNLVENEGKDLDDILAITFTRKAAAQMKDKLHRGLGERLVALTKKNEAGDAGKIKHLQEQINKVSSADVCTIHVFCSRLIKTYYYAANIDGIDSSFTIADEDAARSARIQNRVIDELFEERYGKNDGDFLTLVACFRDKRSDAGLKNVIFEAYKKLRNIPDYREMLDTYAAKFSDGGFDEACAFIHDRLKPRFRQLSKSVSDFYEGLEILTHKNEPLYENFFMGAVKNIDRFVESDDLFVQIPANPFPTKKPIDGAEDKDKTDEINAFVKNVKEKLKKINPNFSDRETELARFRNAGKIAKALCGLLKEYDDALLSARRKENVLDYNDLEHCALKILKENVDIREHVHEKYKYVFVDEFQDINSVQEKIINCLSGDDSKTFFVGDLKQAIYGFRGSESRIFRDTIEKFDEMGHIGDENYNSMSLTYNFRSADNIVKAVNDIFRGAMTYEVCGIDYAGKRGEKGVSHLMTYGGKYSEDAHGRVEIDFFPDSGNKAKAAPVFDRVYSVREAYENSFGSSTNESRHGRAIAAVIDEELRNRIYDIGSDTPRDVRPDDICILVRKEKNEKISEMVNYLIEHGYPVSGVRGDNVLGWSEIRELTDILSCIDNPEQDVAMCAYLLSPLCGFTENDLVEIRTHALSDDNSFRSRAVKYAYNPEAPDPALSQKIRNAFGRLDKYRKLSEVAGASEIIDTICEDAGWTAVYERDDGELIRSIRLLQDKAWQNGHEMSLGDFLRFIYAGEAKIQPPDKAEANCIKVMTMHKAKGLEFPIVIIADVAKTFEGKNDGGVKFNKCFGFAPKWYDTDTMECGDSVMSAAVDLAQIKEEISDELNLFYVACTRAMYSLHIMNSAPKEFDPEGAADATNYNTLVDFVGLTGYGAESDDPDNLAARVTHRNGKKIPYAVIKPEAIDDEDGVAPAEKNIEIDEALLNDIKDAFGIQYKHEDDTALPTRVSATELRRNSIRGVSKKASTGEEKKEETNIDMSDTDTGTAYHKYLQLCDLTKKTKGGIIAEMTRCLDSDTKNLLDVEKLEQILAMPAFADIPEKYYRERKFLCSMRACDIMDDTKSEDEILVDGIIDFMTVEDDSVRIVDYKYSGESDEEIIATYSKQLETYKKAVSIIYGIDKNKITTTILNIMKCREIPVKLDD